MNRFRRDFLAAYISASSDPDTYGKITVLTIPGQVNGPKLAFNAISTDTAVSQDLGVIGRDNQNRIRWGNLLTLPVGQGGLLYVSPVYASPGSSDAASSYPRLIRVAMMYNDKVGYGPDRQYGVGRDLRAGRRCDRHGSGAGQRSRRSAGCGAVRISRRPPTRRRRMPRGADTTGRGGATAAGRRDGAVTGESRLRCKNFSRHSSAVRDAQRGGNFAQYGQALQRLDDAMNKFETAK